MVRGAVYAAIDVGSTKIATVVGDATERGVVRVLGVGIASARGVEKGQISNIAQAAEAVRDSVARAERSSGTRLLSASVSLAGAHLSCLNNRGIIAIPDLTRPISLDDMQRAIDAAQTVSLKSNRELVHAIPRYFVVAGQDRVSDPVGMHGQRLDVEMHLVTGGVNPIQNLIKCVESAGVQVESLIASPVATAASVLRPEEMQEGVALLDIGGGTTDIAVYQDGAIVHTASLPVGGVNVTRDLVVGLHCPFDAAEEAKSTYGSGLTDAVAEDESIRLGAFGAEAQRSVSRRLLTEIIEARVEEILSMALVEIQHADQADRISAGLVLSGGTATLPGIAALAEQRTGLPARIGQIGELYGLTDQITGPAYATTLGMVHWLTAGSEPGSAPVRLRMPQAPSLGRVFRRMGQIGRVFLPQ